MKNVDEGKSCPECETPNQFGEMCIRCQRDYNAMRQEEYDNHCDQMGGN